MNAPVDPAAVEQADAAREAFGSLGSSSPVALVPPEETRQNYKNIVEAHLQNRKRELRRARFGFGVNALLAVSTAALAVALAFTLPLKKLLPVIVHQHEDGTWTTTVAQREVPARLQEATLKSTLWLYVVAAERFNTATHHEDQQVVYTLSDKPTGDAHQARMDPKSKDSPWKRYGTRTTVRIERISEGLGCGTQVCGPGQVPNSYAVRYRRIEQTEGNRPVVVQQQSTVRFHLPAKVPESQIVTYNPAGVQVVQYSWTVEGAL